MSSTISLRTVIVAPAKNYEISFRLIPSTTTLDDKWYTIIRFSGRENYENSDRVLALFYHGGSKKYYFQYGQSAHDFVDSLKQEKIIIKVFGDTVKLYIDDVERASIPFTESSRESYEKLNVSTDNRYHENLPGTIEKL